MTCVQTSPLWLLRHLREEEGEEKKEGGGMVAVLSDFLMRKGKEYGEDVGDM